MKKNIFKISVVAAIALLLSACGSSDSGTVTLTQIGDVNVTQPSDDSTAITAEDMALSKDGKTIFLADGSAGMKAIDVSDPTDPKLIATVDDSSDAGANKGGFGRRIDISTDGQTVYMADGLAGLKVINVEDSAHPELVGKLDTKGFSHGIKASYDGTKVYIADNGEGGVTPGLRIIDVTDPTSPVMIAQRDEQWATQVNLSNDDKTLFMTDKDAGVLIIDVTRPENIKNIGQYEVKDQGISADIVLSKDGQTAYVANRKAGIKILDVSNPEKPTLLSKYDSDGLDGSSIAKSVALSEDGKRLFVANRETGVDVLDIRDPQNPKYLTTFDTSGTAEDVLVSKDGKYLYVADGKAGLKVLEIK